MTRATGHLRLYEGARGAVWYAKLRLPDGRCPQRKLAPAWRGQGRCPDGYLTRRMAEAELRRLLVDVERGDAEGFAAPTGITFADACAEFVRHRTDEKRLSASTLKDYRMTIDRVLTPMIGADTPIEAVDEATVQRVRDALLARSPRPATAHKHFIVLLGILGRARRRKWITTDPAADVERITLDKPSGQYRALEPSQVMALARAAQTDQEAALYLVAAFTGLRLGELRALRWRQVQFALDSILVDRSLPEHGVEKLPKSGNVRSVPMIPEAARALDALSRRGELTEPDDHVFVNALGGPANGDIIRRDWRAAMKRAGLGGLVADELPKGERLRFHDLRHTFGTLAARSWPLSDVQFYMGHADITTTMIYVHAKPRTGAAAELSALIAGELGINAADSGRARSRASL